MTYLSILPDWNSVESVRTFHAFLEGCALIFFAALVVFDVVSHIFGRRKDPRERAFEVLALTCFAIAVLAEVAAFPYSGRNDSLSIEQDKRQREKIAALQLETQKLTNSTEQLRTDEATARAEAEGFKAQVADSDARAKHAEAQVASAKAASKEAVAKSESFRLDIAKANESSAKADARAAEAALELAKFRADRDITGTQREKMLQLLKTKPKSKIAVQSLLSDGREALQYAQKIAKVFEDAGWDVTEPDARGAFMQPVRGVFLVISKDKEADQLSEFVAIALITGEIASAPVMTSPDSKKTPGTVEIWVAGKQ